MVIKGSARAEAGKLAVHLLRTDTNEHMNVREMLGVVSPDLTEALREMEAVASAARSRRPFYHASINTAAHELMTDEQKTRAIDRLEQELGLTGQPRVVVEHVKAGREHLHIAWSRIDGETLKAIPDSHNYRRHEIVARELEREFGHARVQGAHVERDGVERPARCPSHAETRQAERSGMTPEEAKAQLRALWQSADTGQAFAAALDDAGWVLAQGDKRGFVAIDPTGEVRAVNKDITGLSAPKVRERLADFDEGRLPSVDAARGLLRDRQLQPKAEPEPAPEAVAPAALMVEETPQPETEIDAAAEIAIEAEVLPPDQATIQHDQVDETPPKSPEEMRREWAELMRQGRDPAAPENEAARMPEEALAKPKADPAAERRAWAENLRALDKPDPGNERKAWADRLRQFAAEKPEPAAVAEPAQSRVQPSKTKAPSDEPPSERRGLFGRIRDFVRHWWDPAARPEPAPEQPPERRHEAVQAEKALKPASPMKQAADVPRPQPSREPIGTPAAKPARTRSVSDEMLDQARIDLEAERAAETPTQRAEREKREAQQGRGRGTNGPDHGRYHHSLLWELAQPWQQSRVRSQNPNLRI